MKNFGRTLRLVLRYPWTLAGSAICAIMVAMLWGGNIGGMYPIVEIIFGNGGGQTLQAWIDGEIAKEETNLVAINTGIADLKERLNAAPAADREGLAVQLQHQQADLATSESILERRRWLRPYIHNYLPDDAFQTIVLIVGVVILGTLLKDVFLVLDAILFDRLTNLAAMDLRK
jgi:ATP-binding cassette subfamily B protein/subfamily B ATP-binding cassette protein MsbA